MVAAFAIAACGGSTSASSGSPSPTGSPVEHPSLIAAADPCKLVSAADASTAAGVTLIALTSVAIPGVCFYGQQAASGGVFVYAQTYADATAADAVTAQEISAALGTQVGQGATTGKQVAGIGDRAFEFTGAGNAGNGIAIIVFKSNVVLMILVDPAPSATKVEDLARTAVANLNR